MCSVGERHRRASTKTGRNRPHRQIEFRRGEFREDRMDTYSQQLLSEWEVRMPVESPLRAPPVRRSRSNPSRSLYPARLHGLRAPTPNRPELIMVTLPRRKRGDQPPGFGHLTAGLYRRSRARSRPRSSTPCGKSSSFPAVGSPCGRLLVRMLAHGSRQLCSLAMCIALRSVHPQRAAIQPASALSSST